MHPIERYRRARGWTQAALAKKLKVSNNTVIGWEKGAVPRAARMPALAKALRVEPATLVEELDAWESDASADELTPRELRVVEMRYGIAGRPHTFAEIGRELGVTRERARQIDQAATEKLRRIGDAQAAGKPVSPEALRQYERASQQGQQATPAALSTHPPALVAPMSDGGYRPPGLSR